MPFRNFNEAQRIINSLSSEQEIELKQISNEIVKIQDYILFLASEKDFLRECLQCGGKCCVNEIKDMFEEKMTFVRKIDWIFILLVISDQIKEELFRILNKNYNISDGCPMLLGTTCILPNNQKPALCTAYYCQDPDFSEFNQMRINLELLEISTKLIEWNLDSICDVE